MKRWQIVLLITLLASDAHSQFRHEIAVERNFGMIAGTRSTGAAVSLLQEGTNLLLPRDLVSEKDGNSALLSKSYRLLRFVLVDNFIAMGGYIVNHEIFGHGSRARELGFIGQSYEFDMYYPLGFAGRTGLGTRSERGVDLFELVLWDVGGMEANAVASREYWGRAVDSRALHFPESYSLLRSSLDGFEYVMATDIEDYSNDVGSYLYMMNAIHHTEGYIGVKHLRQQAWIQLLNPVLLSSVASVFYSHLAKGRDSMALSMIHFSDQIDYLPALSYQLTPFGPEATFLNYLRLSDNSFAVSIRATDPVFSETWGVGVNAMNLFRTSKLSIAGSIAVWSQPHVVSGRFLGVTDRSVISGSIAVKMDLRPEAFPIGVTIEAGYKGQGYLLGERYEQGPIFRLGMGWDWRK